MGGTDTLALRPGRPQWRAMSMTLDRQRLEAFIPHRGINILPDVLTLDDDRKRAVSRTTVPLDDPHGRRLFARSDGCWLEAFLGELIALTGVPLLAEDLAQEGKVSVFSMISRLRMTRLIPMDEEVVCTTTITRRRGEFTVFASTAEHAGEVVVEAEVLSGAAALSEVTAGAPQPLDRAAGEPIAGPAWKQPSMQFADSVLEFDAAARSLVADYRYPVDHPLVPGHFPAAAVMMGVTQWAAISDAAWELHRRLGSPGTITVNGEITRPDGSQIVDVRGCTLEALSDGHPRVSACKRIAFRDVVKPGDGMLISVSA